MPKTYRVSRQQLEKEAVNEKKEHPWASERTARRIARDHLQEYGPNYSRGEEVAEKVIEEDNKREHVKPKKKHMAPRPYNPMTDGLPKMNFPY